VFLGKIFKKKHTKKEVVGNNIKDRNRAKRKGKEKESNIIFV